MLRANKLPRLATTIGFTLIELMVAITIAMVIAIAVTYVYLSGKQSFRAQEDLSRMQDDARFIFETLTYDLRQAGSMGCASTGSSHTVASTLSGWYADPAFMPQSSGSAPSALPILGYNDATAVSSWGFSNTNAAAKPVVRILRADTDNEHLVTADAASSATTISVGNSSGDTLAANSVVVITDCANSFTASLNSATTTQITLPTTTPVPFALTANSSRVYKLSAALYYLDPTGNLHRKTLQSTTTTSDDILASNVSDFNITYGVDTDGDKAVDSYVAAGTSPLDLTLAANWVKVISVRIAVTLQSQQSTGISSTGAASVVTKTFLNTIALRNRLH